MATYQFIGGELATDLDSDVDINQESDLPAAVSGVITLEDDKHYRIGADFSSANRVILGKNNLRTSGSNNGPTWTYTGTGVAFTGTDVNIVVRNFRFNCPNATDIFILTDTVPQTSRFEVENVTVVSTAKIGTVTDYQLVELSNIIVQSCTDGISFGGSTVNTNAAIIVDRVAFVSTDNSFVGLDFGSAVFGIVDISDFVPFGPAASTAMSGLSGSGNMAPGSIALVVNSEFGQQTSPLSGITRGDIRWNFGNTEGVQNSTNTADTHMTTTQLVIVGGGNQGVFLPVGGTNWSSDIAERFTATSAGGLTYIGEKDAEFQITAIATIEKSGGGSDLLCMRISIDGVSQDFTEACTESNTPTSITCLGLFTLSTNNEIRLDVANIDSTGNINVNSANMSIINGF